MRSLYLRGAFLAVWVAVIAWTASERAAPATPAYPVLIAAAQLGR